MISIIVAATRNHMIGKDNDFPWRLSDDLKRFKHLTVGHTIIMGRGTYDHLMQRIGKMLPDRRTIVVSRNPDFTAPDVTVVHSLDEAFAEAHADDEEVFVVGGAQLYASALPYTNRVYLTEIETELEGDAFFPELPSYDWQEVSREHHEADEKHDYPFSWVTLERR